MATLPPSSDFTGSSVTEGQFKTALTSLRTFIADLLGTSSTDKVAARTALGVPLAAKLDKSGAYTVVAADCGKVINATTGTWSLSLTAAATLGDGFHFALQNSGAGVITIDPNASETIDGATTKAVAAGKFVMVYCDGTKFSSIGSIATGAGSGLDADLLDGQSSAYYAVAASVVGKDIGVYGAGVIAVAYSPSASTASGATVAGSSLRSAYNTGGAALSGTWRNIDNFTVGAAGLGLFQRIS